MADELKTKKITDLEENTTVDDTDILMAGDKGTNALKRFTVAKLFDAIKTKIAGWAFDTLTTTDKTLPGAVNELNSKKDIEYTKDPVVSFANLSVRAANNVVSCHGVIRTAYIGVESRIIFIDAAYKPPYLTHFVWATPDGKSGTGYVDTNGTMIFDTSKLSGINDLYVGFSYIL